MVYFDKLNTEVASVCFLVKLMVLFIAVLMDGSARVYKLTRNRNVTHSNHAGRVSRFTRINY